MTDPLVSRGDIYRLQLSTPSGSEQAGRRPALIIQNDIGNRFGPTTIIAAITSQSRRRHYPFHVPFTAHESGMPRGGIVLCEQIQTVDQDRLGDRVGALAGEKMREVDLALRWSLGLER